MRPLVDLYAFSYLRTCVIYDTIVKVLGFHEVRVRYRAQRHAMLREIILSLLHGFLLKKYIGSQAAERIAEKDRKAFIEDIEQDLEQMDESRIAGLGITLAELKAWQAAAC